MNAIPVTISGTGIPAGCICSYTWAVPGPGVVRNGALSTCPADHSEAVK